MLICFASLTNAQSKDYDTLWKEITKLENQGLIKSASEKVEIIFTKARKDNNTIQKVKCLIHQSKYLQTLEEDSQLKIVSNFKAEIDTSELVTKRLLENLLANLYWQYYNQNRYKFYDRSKPQVNVSDDFRTWDLETLFFEIHTYYERSLQNGLLLQQEPLENYDALLITQKKSKDYRPTLFDFLSYNALEFYKTSENSIIQPAYKFSIDNPDLIAPNDRFISLKLASKDSVNLQLKALKVYQNLLRFHQKDKSSKPFISANISRLDFVKQHATFDGVLDELTETYRKELETIGKNENSALYSYEIANIKAVKALKYRTQDETTLTYRWLNKDALELCESVISKYPKSDAAAKCKNLKGRIEKPSLSLRTESYLPVNNPALILVNYKNLDALDFDIYKINASQRDKFGELYNTKEKEKFIKRLKPNTSFKSQLKNEGDYQAHSIEVVLPALDNGLYIIVAKTNTDVFYATTIQVTDLALLETQEDKQVTYQVINRNNGHPVVNADVKLKYKTYRNREKTFSSSYTTDNYGKFYFKKVKENYHDVYAIITSGNDTGIFGRSYINREYNNRENTSTQYKTFVFTDRSIYRPGQTVYFKGIVTKTVNKNTSIVANTSITAALHNVNGEKVAELSFTTNEYGSFHGEFILPNTGLTGQFSIQSYSNIIDRAYEYISVEEYKRPKFEAQFLPVTESYKVNDSITVKGNAIAFAGSNITDAKVVYRVKRQVQLPRWYFYRRPSFNIEPQEIAFGETKTDASGNFEINFKALPDKSVSKDDLPVFNYEVTADVTDINGETRSVTTLVSVGYHTLTATLNIPQRIDKSQKETELQINTTNLNGEFVPAKGKLKIYKLIAPNTVLRPRPWKAPDYKLLSKEEFKKMFPHEAYDDESNYRNWDKSDVVYETGFDTETSKSVLLKRTKKWASGNYIIELETTDKFGQKVKDQAYTYLYSDKDKTVADNSLFKISLDKQQYAINETALLTFGSAMEDAKLTIEIEKKGEIIETQIHQISDSKHTIQVPIYPDDIGGFVIHYSLAAYNSLTSSSITIRVPYPKTDLEIETSTFRDKLQPGQDETWSFKVKGPKGDKVTAELLASMYDASLNEFKPHNWSFNPIYKPNYSSKHYKNNRNSFGVINFRRHNNFENIPRYNGQTFDRLNWFGLYFGDNIRRYDQLAYSLAEEDESLDEVVIIGSGIDKKSRSSAPSNELAALADPEESEFNINANVTESFSGQVPGLKISKGENSPGKSKANTLIQIRKNLQETAFFFPQLQTDANGNVSFNFKAPEALTKWKLQLLAHTKSLESTVSEYEAVTQKELMVIPNAPRFLREGDAISISTKIANLSDKALTGKAQLVLEDAITGKEISEELLVVERGRNDNTSTTLSVQDFSVDAKGNTQVNWTLKIPDNIQAVQYKVIAQSEDFSDGEQNVLPVLSNRMLVTETLPMWVRSNQTKTFTLDKLASTSISDPNSTLKHHKLTLEITSNPAWYAVQALPYLMEYPYQCNEQTFSRYYANALAQHITKSSPKIEAVFNQWKSTDALLSNLEKNEELKSLLIQETPWLRDAQSETEQKKRIALLFDLNKMNSELQASIGKLKNNQHSSGAWPWFNGGRDNRYITQHIVGGFGHLKQLNVSLSAVEESQMIEKAIRYLDKQFVKEYKDLKRYNPKVDLSKDHLSYTQLHYMYVRSFYPEIKASKEVGRIMDYYKGQIEDYWLSRSLYAKGLMALTMHRAEEHTVASKILRSLKETSITSEELGMYWKANTASYYWHQAPIETQSLLIEAFSEIENNIETVDNLKIWLLKNKQTNKWETTKATAEAVYALLLQGSEWLSITDAVDVKVGGKSISPSKLDNVNIEAGTGYYKTSWNANEISQEQAQVTLTKKGEGIAWGVLYWQYFEGLDKITSAKTPLQLQKKLFKKTNTDRGEELAEINTDTQLKVGDLVRVRIELRSDRDMEFLHLKDMRAAGFEPVNVLSQYKWQDGLGYYESTKDAATNFFIDYLPKGIYIFEYDLRVNNAGDMSNGITTIQSMYAPEFSSHSEGIRVNVN